LNAFSQTKTTFLLGVFLTLPIVLGYCHVYMVPLVSVTNLPSGTLTAIGEDFASPWLCIGNFNFILDQSEKLEGKSAASSFHCPFKTFIDHLGLVNLGFVGNTFTWCNNRQGLATIKERLDRGLASLDWIHLHPDFSFIHLPASISDNPISLNTNTTSSYLPRPFKFEEFWTFDPTCGLVIAAAWKHFVTSSPVVCLVQKLDQTKTSLKR
jgi:hypothetical protein